ncbi:hypothetical protein Patl1_31650 [Pistacia atlantica]|uniref:Uncharacterized protein n=1 Tax=Pistacia atlantica TaxID=434234 RepID=A0ACC1AQ82_9ROSI|nr:hypothetical protein Patl1_31650 [Pistacia atlantica]
MVGPERPQFVLFGSSIVQLSFSNEGWGSILADIYARKDKMQIILKRWLLIQNMEIIFDRSTTDFELHVLGRHTFARILWLEFKAWPTSTRTNFSQGN